MRLNHNMASYNLFIEQNKSLKTQSRAMSRISSGVKIQSSKDSPIGLAQSEKIRMQIRGLQVAQRNSQDGASMIQTAEGGLDNATSMLQRMRELTVQAQDGINTTQDKVTIQNEIKQLVGGFDDIMKNTEFNGNKLLCNNGSINVMLGSNAGDNVQIPMYDLTSSNIGIGGASAGLLNNIDVTTSANASSALDTIDQSLSVILDARGRYGALQNRFEDTVNINSAISDNLEKADSDIRDSDVAAEMMDVSRTGILIEAGNALMAQTNRFPQDILRILDKVK